MGCHIGNLKCCLDMIYELNKKEEIEIIKIIEPKGVGIGCSNTRNKLINSSFPEEELKSIQRAIAFLRKIFQRSFMMN